MTRVTLNILWPRKLRNSPATLKTGIKEYVDNINNDINIYNFPWQD